MINSKVNNIFFPAKVWLITKILSYVILLNFDYFILFLEMGSHYVVQAGFDPPAVTS